MDGENVIGVLKAFHFIELLSVLITGFQVFTIGVSYWGTFFHFRFYGEIDQSISS